LAAIEKRTIVHSNEENAPEDDEAIDKHVYEHGAINYLDCVVIPPASTTNATSQT